MYSTTSVCEAQNNGGRFVSYPRQGHFYRVIRRIRKPKQKVLVLIDHERLRKIVLYRGSHATIACSANTSLFSSFPARIRRKCYGRSLTVPPEALGASDNMRGVHLSHPVLVSLAQFMM